jgi:hypothetical protein
MPSRGAGRGGIALPRGREGPLSREQDRDGPIRVMLLRIAAQVCMNVM